MKYYLNFLIYFLLISLNTINADAQQFVITDAGELNLDTDQITQSGKVTKYLGINVEGAGEAILQISVGDLKAQKNYDFRLSQTQLFSFLFNNDLGEEINKKFANGVVAEITFSILDTNGVLIDSFPISIDKSVSRKNCSKLSSFKLENRTVKKNKQCKKVALANLKLRLKKLFVEELISSIRGPIFLEP